MGSKYKKPAKPSVANGGKHRCPDCKKPPIASCFGKHLFMCFRHPKQCYTKINSCQLCEGEHRRKAEAKKLEQVRAKELETQRRAEQREESRRKEARKTRWTDAQKNGRLTAMRAKSG